MSPAQSGWTRRGAAVALAALAGCAGPPILLNLAQDQAGPDPDRPSVLETAFDPASRMTVPVRLDGAGPFPFVVDTGANLSAISLELADQLGLPRMGVAPVHGVAGVQDAPLTRVRRLSVGPVSAPAPRLPLLPRSRMGVDGLLGMDVLRQRRLRMDFREGRIEIARSFPRQAGPGRSYERRDPDSPQFRVPARMRFGQLVIVDAEVAGVRVTAFLDTGSQNTIANIALRDAFLRRRPTFAASLSPVTLLSATGQTAEGELGAIPPLRLGGLLIGELVVAFGDLHIFDVWGLQRAPAVLVGMDVLRHFNSVEIDYGLREVAFRPPAGSLVRGLD